MPPRKPRFLIDISECGDTLNSIVILCESCPGFRVITMNRPEMDRWLGQHSKDSHNTKTFYRTYLKDEPIPNNAEAPKSMV